MTLPLSPGSYEERAVIDGAGFVRAVGVHSLALPSCAILGYSNSLVPLLRAREFSQAKGYPPLWGNLWLAPEKDIVVVEGFGIGAPAAAFVLEGICALGVNRVVTLGWAGALSSHIALGDIIVCTKAIRDEGLSYHYLPPARYAYPDPSLTSLLTDRAVPSFAGPSWTTDALFRETPSKVASYSAEGVLTVEMEAAGLFAVAQCLEISLAAGFCISDHLASSMTWELSVTPNHQLGLLLDAALEALVS